MRKIKAILLASHGIGAYALKWDNPSRTVSPRWEAEVARDYKVVGPFPQEAREQHFLSPARPLGSKIMLPLDYEGSFPSHLADGGFVLWKGSSVSTESAGMEVSHYKKPNVVHYSIAFPEVRWGSIRATEGWSGLQHHALLHTKIRLTPPRTHAHIPPVEPIYLVLSASQCSYFAILGFKSELSTPQWYTCNIYDHANVPPIRIPLKPYLDSHLRRQTFLEPTTEIMELNVLMSLDYEIRLFGDPAVSNNGTMPIIEADFSVEVEGSSGQNLAEGIGNEILGSPIFERNQLSLSQDSLGRHTHCMRTNPNAHIFPHFVAGWAYGEAVGIEISSCSKEAWSISLGPSSIDGWATNEIHLELVEPTRIAPSQTRLVSMRLTQAKRLTIPNASLTLELRLRPENNSHSKAQTISVTIPIQNHPSFSQPSEDTQGILLTYHSVSGTPASAVVLPPPNESHQITSRSRILLALHGAGVMHTHSFWISALPRPEHAWVLVVQGLTPWGLDWREASRADVCAALRALVLQLVGIWREADYCTTHDLITEVVLPKRPSTPVEAIPVVAIGHSNGGQGSLHLASLFP
ncbi:hypothetical protein OPQ81_008124 [Rhizoctonia solani]|nr:hypothetical protein OPQ81_008124 [Rhizoctonia solani]